MSITNTTPRTPGETLTYEAWRISYQSSEQAARGAFSAAATLQAEVARLQARVRDYEQALTNIRGVVGTSTEAWHIANNALAAASREQGPRNESTAQAESRPSRIIDESPEEATAEPPAPAGEGQAHFEGSAASLEGSAARLAERLEMVLEAAWTILRELGRLDRREPTKVGEPPRTITISQNAVRIRDEVWSILGEGRSCPPKATRTPEWQPPEAHPDYHPRADPMGGDEYSARNDG